MAQRTNWSDISIKIGIGIAIFTVSLKVLDIGLKTLNYMAKINTSVELLVQEHKITNKIVEDKFTFIDKNIDLAFKQINDLNDKKQDKKMQFQNQQAILPNEIKEEN